MSRLTCKNCCCFDEFERRCTYESLGAWDPAPCEQADYDDYDYEED